MSKPTLRSCTFFVEGTPIGKGSFCAVISKSTGKPFPKPASKETKPWQKQVAFVAKLAWKGDPSERAIRLTTTFVFNRPLKHYFIRKFGNVLRPDAPNRHTVQPDRDKLLRTIQDALTGVVYVDDSQADCGDVRKVWVNGITQPEGVLIEIRELN